MQLSALQELCDEKRAWRKQELSQARGLAESRIGTADEAYLCRVWTLVMYAHCDQFVKEISRLYIEYLRHNPRVAYDYTSIWFAFRAKELILRGSDDNYRLCRNLCDLEKEALFDLIVSDEILKGQSFNYKNLRFLLDWVLQIDFDISIFRGFCTTLKTKRDQIAHGERVYVEKIEDCIAWHNPTIALIDSLTEQVVATAIGHSSI